MTPDPSPSPDTPERVMMACPFDGSPAECVYSGDCDRVGDQWTVRCTRKVPLFGDFLCSTVEIRAKKKADAIAAWNRRAPREDADAVAELRAAIEAESRECEGCAKGIPLSPTNSHVYGEWDWRKCARPRLAALLRATPEPPR